MFIDFVAQERYAEQAGDDRVEGEFGAVFDPDSAGTAGNQLQFAIHALQGARQIPREDLPRRLHADFPFGLERIGKDAESGDTLLLDDQDISIAATTLLAVRLLRMLAM